MDSGARDRLIEVLVGFFLWAGKTYCFLSLISFFFYQHVIFIYFFGRGLLSFLLAMTSVALPYSALCFFEMHKRELVELCQGQSDLAPVVALLNNFAAYVLLQYLYVPASFALIFVTGLFMPLILIIGTKSTLVAPYIIVTAVHTYIGEKLTRFNRLEGPRLAKVPPDAPFINRWLSTTDRWLELLLYPPAQLAIPRYMTILPEERRDALSLNEDETPLLDSDLLLEDRGEISSEAKCQICGSAIGEGEQVSCARCDTPHHLECWEWSGGCSIYGCGCKEAASE